VLRNGYSLEFFVSFLLQERNESLAGEATWKIINVQKNIQDES